MEPVYSVGVWQGMSSGDFSPFGALPFDMRRRGMGHFERD